MSPGPNPGRLQAAEGVPQNPTKRLKAWLGVHRRAPHDAQSCGRTAHVAVAPTCARARSCSAWARWAPESGRRAPGTHVLRMISSEGGR